MPRNEALKKAREAMSEQPKDCPCCGSSAALRDDCDDQSMDGPMNWWVVCNGITCMLNTGGYYIPEDALEAWNLRAHAK